jgi:hypothetical protein
VPVDLISTTKTGVRTREEREEILPRKAHKNRSSAAIIILWLMQQLDDILADSVEVPTLAHLVYSITNKTKET